MAKTISKTLTKQTLTIFWRHARKYPWYVAFTLTGIFITTAITAYTPILYRNIVDVLSGAHSEAVMQTALHIVLVIFIITAIKVFIWRLVNFTVTHFESSAMRDITNSCYVYLQKHSLNFFSSSFVGSLVTKVKRYERSFEQIADQVIYDLGRVLLELAIILGILFFLKPVFGWIFLGWSFLFITIAYGYALYKLPYDMQRAEADTHTTAQLADSLTNNINVKLFTNYNHENQRFADVTDEQFRFRKRSWNLGVWGDVVQSSLMVLLEFAVMYLAIKKWYAGEITIGDVVLLQAYLGRIFDKLWNVGKNIRTIYEAIADANEMTEIILAPHGIQDKENATSLVATKGAISFNNVVFGYHANVPVLDNFNLNIKAGERIAIIGSSGGGKSTIMKLLFRFYDINSGEITIDGQNIADVTQDSVRAAMAFVPQEPILFHRSLMENIRYARPDATDEEVIQAGKLAHAHEFIESFSEGYETLVGERGVKLSGGERQRVAIARAILKDAPILVLDEATSSLDSESEMYIQDALRELMRNRTTIVIAHRLSTIMQMDRIVVIDGGKIIEEGKHEELLKAQQGTYQKLWEIQAGGFTPAS